MNAHANFTPGPWGYEDPMGPDILTIVANPDAPVYEWIWIAQIGTEPVEDDAGKVHDNRSFEEHEANACLIAAAPDMFAALVEARTQVEILQGRLGIKDHGSGTLSIIDAALSKAVASRSEDALRTIREGEKL